MNADGITETDISDIFKKLLSIPSNKVCNFNYFLHIYIIKHILYTYIYIYIYSD